MKKIKVLSNLLSLGLAAIIAAPASAQTAAGRAATPGASAGIVPVSGGGPIAPLVNGTLSPSALSLAPSVVPVAPAPQAVAASGVERMKAATVALAAMPDPGKASSAQMRDAGAILEEALTGERGVLSAAAVDASPRGHVEVGGGVADVAVVRAAAVVMRIRAEIAKVIVGQKEMIDSILIAMIAGEHVLLEGVPGVAKTQTVNALADAVEGGFNRVQGAHDLMPSDVLGAEILEEDPATGRKEFKLKRGPVFTNILLADEINRTTPKTQAAFLQAMQERKVTIGGNTLDLPKPFTVLATMNPLEQEGVFPLPEAAQDRFMFKVLVPKPSKEELIEIMHRFSGDNQPKAGKITTLAELVEIRKIAEKVRVNGSIETYIASIVDATNNPMTYGIAAEGVIESGASPRAAIFLLKAAKINALLEGRAWVGPRDVRKVAARVLRHRLTLSYAAHELTTDQVIENILSKVPIPQPLPAAATPVP